MTPFRGFVFRALAFAASATALVAALSACGYHLAGSGDDQGRIFSPVLKRVSIEGLGRYESLRKTLVVTLHGYGVKVVSPARASARLIFSGRRERQRRSAVGDDVKAREYMLTVETSFSVRSGGKKLDTLLPEQTVKAEAAYLTDPDRPLLSKNEKRTVAGDLEAELCRKIVLRLSTIGR